MFNQKNIAELVAGINAGFKEQLDTIKEFIKQLLPLKTLEYVGAQKFAKQMTTVSQLYAFINSDEMQNVVYDALEETLFGEEMTQSAQHIRLMTKIVIKDEIEAIADDIVRNFVSLLIDQQLVEFQYPQTDVTPYAQLLQEKTILELKHNAGLLRTLLDSPSQDIDINGVSYNDSINAEYLLNLKFILK